MERKSTRVDICVHIANSHCRIVETRRRQWHPPLQYSCLENPMNGGAWLAAVHGVANSRARLSDFTFAFHFYALEKKMATHSSVLARRIPGTGEPGGLPFYGVAQSRTRLKRLSSSSREKSMSRQRLLIKDVMVFCL